jgi:hypothetical protein
MLKRISSPRPQSWIIMSFMVVLDFLIVSSPTAPIASPAQNPRIHRHPTPSARPMAAVAASVPAAAAVPRTVSLPVEVRFSSRA